MNRCDPTGVLRDEHRLILRVVDSLESTLDAGPEGDWRDRVGEYVTFFRLFTDACHHGKEEDLLFEALAERGFSREAGPLAALLEEHREGRSLVRRMASARDAVAHDEAEAWARFSDAGRDYVELIRRHIEKEDDGVFDVADGALPEPACRRLCDRYDELCAARFEGRSATQLRELGERIAGL